MPQTVDAHHGELIEETGLSVSSPAAPTTAGELFYYGGQWLAYDAIGSFDIRTHVQAHASSHAKSAADVLAVQNLGSGAAPANKTFQTDGAGGVALVDYVEAYPPNLQSGEYLTPFSTSAAGYQQVYRYTTTSIPAGKYFFVSLANLDCTNSGNVTDARVQIDDTTTFARFVGPVAYVGGVSQLIGVRTVTLTAGTHNIDFDILKASGNGNVIMISAYITLWRVS